MTNSKKNSSKKIDKKISKTTPVEAESQEDFLKRIKSVMEKSASKQTGDAGAFSKQYEEAKASGAKLAGNYKEIEECKKIAEEFKVSPPILTTKNIGSVCVERYYDKEVQPKIDLLKKHFIPFLSVTHNTSIFPIIFETFGNAYIKRGGKQVNLPKSSIELPFIIKDGDIIGTGDKSFVLDLRDENQDEDNNFWHIFVFPNSELKISISEKVSHPAPGFMVASEVPSVIKNGSKATVYNHKIEKIELLSGLFNIRVKKKGRDVNNIVKLASGYPNIEFNQTGGLVNEIVKNEMEKAVAALGAAYLSKVADTLNQLKSTQNKRGSDEINSIIELNKDGSVIIFNTSNRIALGGSSKLTKKISADITNPVKITATRGSIYESDGSKNPDPRVSAIMKMWLSVSSYVGSLKIKAEYENKINGRSLNVEEAEKMIEYAKSLGDKDMEAAAKAMLKKAKDTEEMEKGIAARTADKEGQKRDALEQLKFAEESGEKDLIEIAKIQLKNIDSPSIGLSPVAGAEKAMQLAEENLRKIKPLFEINLPPYNHPNSSDMI